MRVEREAGHRFCRTSVGPDEDFEFYLKCSGKLLNGFEKSGVNCFII